jgi:hypothetical protein
LLEFLVAFAIASFTIGSLITGYVLSARNSEFVTTMAAGQRLVQSRMEQIRAARWDLYSVPPVQEISGLVGLTNGVPLDLPDRGFGPVTASLRTSVFELTNNYPPLIMVKIECWWTLDGTTFTNMLVTYRGPDS